MTLPKEFKWIDELLIWEVDSIFGVEETLKSVTDDYMVFMSYCLFEKMKDITVKLISVYTFDSNRDLVVFVDDSEPIRSMIRRIEEKTNDRL